MKAALRKERLEARVSRDQKKLFEKAARLQGRTVTDFVVTSAQEAATRILQEHEVIALSTRDREAFVAALLNPPLLRGRLANALERYRHLFAE